jgi:hypothetical protein
MFSLIGLLLLIGSIQVTESQRSSSTTMDGKALLLTAEQNCSAQYTVSSTCKNHLSSSAESMQIIVKFNNSAYNQQNLDQILGDLCNSCGTDFGNIVPLNVDQQSSFVCSSLIYVYNTLPVMCKKNDQGKWKYCSFKCRPAKFFRVFIIDIRLQYSSGNVQEERSREILCSVILRFSND